MKERIPRLTRQESWRYKRVRPKWRRPRGGTSKMRVGLRGWPPLVSAGYGTPKRTSHLHPSGYRDVVVSNPRELEDLDPKVYVAKIAHTVGERKRLQIIEKADELGVRVLNRGRELEPKVVVEEPVQEGQA